VSLGLDGYLDGLAPSDDLESFENVVKTEAMSDEICDWHGAGSDEFERPFIVRWAGPADTHDGQLAVVNEVRVDRDVRGVLRETTEEAETASAIG
jgi:hypothetical protein